MKVKREKKGRVLLSTVKICCLSLSSLESWVSLCWGGKQCLGARKLNEEGMTWEQNWMLPCFDSMAKKTDWPPQSSMSLSFISGNTFWAQWAPNTYKMSLDPKVCGPLSGHGDAPLPIEPLDSQSYLFLPSHIQVTNPHLLCLRGILCIL